MNVSLHRLATPPHISSFFLALVFLSLFLPQCAFGGQRVALVIGNGAYGSSPLANPVNDATDMAHTLERLGFVVVKETNSSKKSMIQAISRFSTLLKRAEIGLFYFAGHGMQINGRNYLIPIGVNVAEESDVEFEAVAADRVIAKMRGAGNRLNMVVLDACRNNPFKRSFRSGSQGLARMDAPKGTVIAYATGPGSVAEDGGGRNGTFTKHLLQALQRPGLAIQDIFNEAGMGVMAETDDRQIPWTSNTPIPRYYLAGEKPVLSTGTPGAIPPAASIGVNTPTTKERPGPQVASVAYPPAAGGAVPPEILRRGVLRVGMEPGYMPFELTANNGEIIGFDVDLAKQAAREMGVKLEIVSTAWNGIIPALLADKFDLLWSGMTVTEAREKVVDFVPYITIGQTVVIRRELQGVVRSYRDLNSARYRVGSKLGTTGEQAAKRYIPKATYLSYEAEQEGVMDLVNGKIDAFVYDMPFNAIATAVKGRGRLVHLDTPFTKEVLGMALPKNKPEFRRWLTAFMARAQQNGSYREKYNSWFREQKWLQRIQ